MELEPKLNLDTWRKINGVYRFVDTGTAWLYEGHRNRFTGDIRLETVVANVPINGVDYQLNLSLIIPQLLGSAEFLWFPIYLKEKFNAAKT
jgi:hypothetical protein